VANVMSIPHDIALIHFPYSCTVQY